MLGLTEFRRAASTLGFELDEPSALTGRIFIRGVVDGIRVQVEHWRGQFVHTDFRAFLEPPSDLHFSLRPASLVDRVAEMLGKHDVEVGDPAFDKEFLIKASEPERMLALLTPEVQRELLHWVEVAPRFYLDNEAVQLFVIPGAYTPLEPDAIVADARAAAALAKVVSAALPGVPPSKRLEPQLAPWRELASEHGLAFSASPLRVQGKIAGTEFVARVVPSDDKSYGVDVRLHFAARLPWFLRVRPARITDFLERTGDAEGFEVDDELFDNQLRVTTSDLGRTKAWLDADARALLLELHRAHGAVLLDSEGLSVRTNELTSPATFAAIVDRVAAVAEKLRPVGA